MTPQEALEILNRATQPAVIGRLTRADFVNVESALGTLDQFIKLQSVAIVEKEADESAA